MQLRLTLISLIFLLLTACRTMNTVMDSYVGQHIDDVMAQVGAPESQVSRSDGGMTYTYVSLSGDKYGVDECRQTFVTNSQKIVVAWSHRGCSFLVPRW